MTDHIEEPIPEIERSPGTATRSPSESNVRQDQDIFVSDQGAWNDEHETFYAPSGTRDQVHKTIAELPNISLNDTEAGRRWAAALNAGMESIPFRNVFFQTVNRPESQFHQYVGSERGPLTVAEPQFKHNTGTKLQGERALMRVRSLMGMGSIIQIPLWHSGFWITFKAPSEGAQLELMRRLIEEKVNLGRQTNGLIFANTSAFVSGWLMDFVLAHIYDTSISDPDAKLSELIATPDLILLVWGLACSIWPNGFQYSRACINDPTKCNHVVQEKVKISKLLWTDTSALTPWQISHMANRGGSTMSLDSIKRYREEFVRGKQRMISLNDDGTLKMTLHVPSLAKHLSSGQKWVNNLVAMVDGAFGETPNDNVRNHYINEQGKATSMRQFAHWVESIDADGVLIDDPETIETILDSLSSQDEVRGKYFEEVNKYIDDCMISVVAVPAYDCPECQMPQSADLPRFPHLLPIDVISTFFTLLVPKLRRIQTR